MSQHNQSTVGISKLSDFRDDSGLEFCQLAGQWSSAAVIYVSWLIIDRLTIDCCYFLCSQRHLTYLYSSVTFWRSVSL